MSQAATVIILSRSTKLATPLHTHTHTHRLVYTVHVCVHVNYIINKLLPSKQENIFSSNIIMSKIFARVFIKVNFSQQQKF